MRITHEVVDHVARLSRLDLTDEERRLFLDQLNTILSYFAKLDTLDTEGVAPTAQALAGENVFRADIVTPSLPVEEALSMAPESRDGHFVVPAVFEPDDPERTR
ncbi:MAG: Asp-tRNA(Asn)/Glu-tRNA(Gln) amidotransferase subunit GatC [Armatimonadetes bacterium]|nr:Asp-tRNA(Asn)/Glu-tRNA(Gln) amidotransferase subunit GatC [Armatimonadota bacterium]